jgi:serine/threonine protein kinase
VRSRLRSDAVGTEYLCRPTDDPGTRCTLKVLRARLTDDAACDAYLRFANRLAKLSHPHVVGVLDAGVYQQQPYLVRPYVDGVRLTELLAATGLQSRPSRVMLRIFQDILEGLIAIHSPRRFGGDTLHFVHGALTADHVLIRPDGRAVLSGVGEVTILGPTSSDPGQDLLALRLMINGALPGGIDEKDLRLRWFADARRGPEVRAVELLRELREMTAQANSLARGDEVVAWVRSLRVASRGPAGPSGMPAAPAPTVPVRAGVFASLRAWWKRRFRPRS